jgi:subtilisin family serine protease
MRPRLTLALVSLAVAACTDATAPPAPPAFDGPNLAKSQASDVIPNHYIVVFRDGIPDVPGLAQRLSAKHGGKHRFTYEHVLQGFAVELPPGLARKLEEEPEVAFIESDRVVNLEATQTNPTWGIDRIDERALPLSASYTYTATGSGVRVYIIDTGLQANHPQFGGRASNVYDAFGGSGSDCHGHGTHVGGTVASQTYGVAKGAMLRGVRVLNCSGSGSTSGIIAGLDWVRRNHVKPAVANMSLGGGFSSSLNTATTNLSNAGVFIAVAAGNSNANACSFSPASAGAATTVASSTSTDAKSSFSNFGSCVDVYAPGSSITSSWIGSSTRTISGTSMASPHVAGVAALYKSRFGDAASSTIDSWIKTNATTNVITGNPSGTPNRLLFKSTL